MPRFLYPAKGYGDISLNFNIQKLFFDYFGVNDIIMTYSIQIIFEIKIFCIKIAWFAHFKKTVTSKASKSLVFVFFLQKITPFLQKYVWCILTHNYTKHHTFIHFRLMGIHFYSKLSCNLLEWNFWKSQHLEWADSFNVTCNWQTGIFKLVFANNLWIFTINYNSLTVVNWA